MKTLKPLPISIQHFEKLRKNGCIYVDKTHLIYNLATQGSTYFLSRPRRFGKSLLISTFDALFSGKKELFDGLWIETSDWEWKTHPVIRLDMSNLVLDNLETYTASILDRFSEIAAICGISLDISQHPKMVFAKLITALSSINPVVILIDEYDKPIIDHISDPEKAIQFRDFMKGFYGCLKDLGNHIRFLFITGVSKFSKVSIFSELNHLEDLTMSPHFSALVGYTQEELETCFSDWIEATASSLSIPKNTLLAQMKSWYNGYQFSRKSVLVYNPFSTLRFFKEQEFSNFWFESGTPTFLPALMKTQGYDGGSLEAEGVDEAGFSTYEINNLHIPALLFQTGYTTIKNYDPDTNLYALGYPNFEVESSFIKYLAKTYTTRNAGDIPHLGILMKKALSEADFPRLEEIIQSLFASIPYHLHENASEAYYHTIFYVVFKMIGAKIQAEELTNLGRIDAVLALPDKLFIMEFKLDDSAQAAIAQIKKKQYAQKFGRTSSEKTIYLLGLAFSRAKRNLSEWKVEVLD